ncbi:MAG: hypothetical protein RJA37_699 [Verrucomicrobiota bacterium]
MDSISSFMPVPFRAETGLVIVSPPQSSGVMPRCCICCFTRSTFAPLASTLFTAHTMAPACFWANLRASSVCGMKPSSAATTSTATSVTLAPRSRILAKAAWPGVSRKVTVRPWYSGFSPWYFTE